MSAREYDAASTVLTLNGREVLSEFDREEFYDDHRCPCGGIGCDECDDPVGRSSTTTTPPLTRAPPPA